MTLVFFAITVVGWAGIITLIGYRHAQITYNKVTVEPTTLPWYSISPKAMRAFWQSVWEQYCRPVLFSILLGIRNIVQKTLDRLEGFLHKHIESLGHHGIHRNTDHRQEQPHSELLKKVSMDKGRTA